MPTLVTASHEAFISGFSAIRQACEQESWVDQMVAGCHQEGPYISRKMGLGERTLCNTFEPQTGTNSAIIRLHQAGESVS